MMKDTVAGDVSRDLTQVTMGRDNWHVKKKNKTKQLWDKSSVVTSSHHLGMQVFLIT